MNFNELFQKMRELDKPVDETAGGTGAGAVATAMPMSDDEMDEDNPGMGPYTGEPTGGAKSNVKQSPAELDFKAAQANAATMRTQGDVRKADAAAAKQADWQKALGAGSSIEECGGDMMPMGPMSSPKQQDSVSMNLSMNGSGSGGIRDLLDILRNLDQAGNEEGALGDLIDKMGHSEPDHKDVIIGSEIEEFANSPDTTQNPDPQYAPASRMTATGDDMHSKGAERLKVNGGGNPMQEQLASRLANMYEDIKSRYTN